MRRLPSVPRPWPGRDPGRRSGTGELGRPAQLVRACSWWWPPLSSWVLTFPARRIAVQIGYVAQPDDRKVHTAGDPPGRAGWPCSWPCWSPGRWPRRSRPSSPLFRGSSEPLGLILGAAAIFVVGLIDDFRDMSAPAKVAGEVLAATILYFMGVTWFQFKVPLAGLVQLSPEWTPLLTALWVIAITNAVNLIDGLDGLAAGVVAIASGALAVYGLHLQHLGNLPTDNIGPLIAVVTCGICLGFLPHNFHPAKIFMGDAGALLLGLLMAASTMLIGGRSAGDRSAGWRPAAARPTSSSPPCSSPSSSSACPSWTWPSPSCAGRPTAPGSPPRTRTICTTACSAWATATAAASSSCGPGRSCCPGFILFPLYISSVNAVIPFGALALGVILYTLFHPSLRRQAEPGPTARRRRRAAEPDGPVHPAVRGPGPRRPDGAGGPARPGPRPATVRRPPGRPGVPPEPVRPKCERRVSPFCRHGCGSAMMHPVNCRPPAPSGVLQSGRQPDRLRQPNHCVNSGTTREAPTPQTP